MKFEWINPITHLHTHTHTHTQSSSNAIIIILTRERKKRRDWRMANEWMNVKSMQVIELNCELSNWTHLIFRHFLSLSLYKSCYMALERCSFDVRRKRKIYSVNQFHSLSITGMCVCYVWFKDKELESGVKLKFIIFMWIMVYGQR
jgi:hypothetical protein